MKKLILSFSTLFILTSCEKVIDIDLNESAPTVVVEGHIELGESAVLKLTETTSYFNPESPSFIENLQVTLSTSNGFSETLSYQSNGEYKGQSIIGQENISYDLTFDFKNKTYSSITALNPKVDITDLRVHESLLSDQGSETEYQVITQFYDDPNTNNYYRLKYYENDILVSGFEGYLLVTDELVSSENMISTTLRRTAFKKGQRVKVELHTLDKATYIFFKTLADNLNSNGMNSATPFNPTSNVSNGALGYFSAWSIDSMEIVI